MYSFVLGTKFLKLVSCLKWNPPDVSCCFPVLTTKKLTKNYDNIVTRVRNYLDFSSLPEIATVWGSFLSAIHHLEGNKWCQLPSPGTLCINKCGYPYIVVNYPINQVNYCCGPE